MELENKNIAAAIIAVMKAVKGIDKTITIGEGRSSYKGVSDQEVKKIIGEAMAKNGLCILPIGIKPSVKIDRWEQEDFFNGKSNGVKTKQSVFTEVTTRYLSLHESGESIELEGYGHGIDSQDKGAGKATTYALKYALLYAFLVPTGKIDDADNTHSENIPTPVLAPKKAVKLILNPQSDKWNGAVLSLKEGKTTIDKIEKVYELTAGDRELLLTSSI